MLNPILGDWHCSGEVFGPDEEPYYEVYNDAGQVLARVSAVQLADGDGLAHAKAIAQTPRMIRLAEQAIRACPTPVSRPAWVMQVGYNAADALVRAGRREA